MPAKTPYYRSCVADDITVRPLHARDIPAAQLLSYEVLREAGTRYGWHMADVDDAARIRGERRLAHCLTHDPSGAFVAEHESEVVGVAVATRRERLWFLSLLTVDTRLQGRGIGRRLLTATLTTFAEAGLICASDDPKALRRYRAAGFSLLPCYEARGPLDRKRVQAGDGVRPGSFEQHRDLVEEVARGQRGAPHGVDLDFSAASDRSLFVTDSGAGRGYAICSSSGPLALGATTADAATRLLWTALASATDQRVEVSWLSHDQQWALDVVTAAGLSLRPTGSRCVRGPVGPMSPYLPSGGLG